MSHERCLRVVIAEDDAGVRAALAEVIEGEPAFELVGQAADATEAISLAAAMQPDVVLVDVRMPGGGGEAAARGIALRSPGSKVIALSGQGDRSTVINMLEAGVVGYLVKGGSVVEIVDAIKRAPEGQGSLSIEVTGDVIQELVGQLNARTRTRDKHRTHERRIQQALGTENGLSMVYQPIVTLLSGEIVGAEALARFAGPPQRSPGQWFAEAGTVGLRVELELHAIRKATKVLPDIPADAYLTVNASPATLTKPAFYKLVAAADTSRLVVEITEHAQIQDYARLGSALAELRALGMRLAIDDAGAGYASLRHILNLEPDLIKLDLTLIRDIHRDRSKQALAAGLISFADRSGSKIIAEGIERATEAQALIGLGVETGQGFYLGRPGPLPLGSRGTNRPRMQD